MKLTITNVGTDNLADLFSCLPRDAVVTVEFDDDPLPAFPEMSWNEWNKREARANRLPWNEDPQFPNSPAGRDVWMSTDCPTCVSLRGHRCVTASGSEAGKNHKGRVYNWQYPPTSNDVYLSIEARDE